MIVIGVCGEETMKIKSKKMAMTRRSVGLSLVPFVALIGLSATAGCDPDMDEELEALVIAASVRFSTPFEAVRR